MTEIENNALVRYSRAGDEFHYRWAARRCLLMIHPNSKIESIVIEGSKENKLSGEYVIDVTEYESINDSKGKNVFYYQLKHSTKKASVSFVLSDLKSTIEGFAKRFKDLNRKANKITSYKFCLITNRVVANSFKENLAKIKNNEKPGSRFLTTITKYSKLSKKQLQKFCSVFEIVDNEGDYNLQKFELQSEISNLLSSSADSDLVNNIIALVRERALPDSNGEIIKEDILKRFGVSSYHELFPAPPIYDDLNLDKIIRREQIDDLIRDIIKSNDSIIIHACGGVGKSVVANTIANELPKGSAGIVYDCFGAGQYRNQTRTRHRHRDALIQIVNEIASLGLCDPVIRRSNDLPDELLRTFLNRIGKASTILKERSKEALLTIFIDAADNAEMAAQEFNDSCFVKHLIKEEIPTGCRIVFLCRTERIELLKPPLKIKQIELKSFSLSETTNYLNKYFTNTLEYEIEEFHRLTSGNPRIQANAISSSKGNIKELLANIGHSNISLDDQINNQLELAVNKVKESIPEEFHYKIENICIGLASLNPFIPIEVLAKAASVTVKDIKSFIFELQRPLLCIEDNIMFRDEPTETWFKDKFNASLDQVKKYIELLKPLAEEYSYVAGTLPLLLSKSNNYVELIDLALSESYLPKDNPIDKRNIKIFRLQFAFKASLKQEKYSDAIKLALLIGEELAGKDRQIAILNKNTDLVAKLQSKQKVQELAFKHILSGGWTGSQNIYSASLLSNLSEFKGDAASYLRSASKWLKIFFAERDKNEDNKNFNESLNNEEIVEFALTHLNLFGVKKCVEFILSWRPPEVIFRVTRIIISRLIDVGDFDLVNQICDTGCNNKHLVLAAAAQLIIVGRFPPKNAVHKCIDLLDKKKIKLKKDYSFHSEKDNIQKALVAILESSLALNYDKKVLLRITNSYFDKHAPIWLNSDLQESPRNIFLRIVALRAVLIDAEPDIEQLLPLELKKEKLSYDNENKLKEFKEIFDVLLPWYLARIELFVNGDEVIDFDELESKNNKILSHRYREPDRLFYEVSRIKFETIILFMNIPKLILNSFIENITQNKVKLWPKDKIEFLRAAYRLNHLSSIRLKLETACRTLIQSFTDESPETISDWYIELSRAVLAEDINDSAVYFENAIEIVSKFGDEILERWDAVISLAKRINGSTNKKAKPELVYRFGRCAELVLKYVESKHFDYRELFKILFSLNPEFTFATLSRWRDRDVGYFNDLLSVVAYNAVSTDEISPNVCWALTAFSWNYEFDDFIEVCVKKENDKNKRQYIYDSAVKILRQKESDYNQYRDLQQLGNNFSISNEELNNIVSYYNENPSEKYEYKAYKHKDLYEKNISKSTWDNIFKDINLLQNPGISVALNKYKTLVDSPWCFEKFWEELYLRVTQKDSLHFLKTLANETSLDIYDYREAFAAYPKSWYQKVSIKKNFKSFVKQIAKQFAIKLTNKYSLEAFYSSIPEDYCTLSEIRESIFSGLLNCNELNDSEVFWSFIVNASHLLKQEEANRLFDFAISRFEKYIDDDCSDGIWGEWLVPPESIVDSFAGLIWGALGAPEASVRWNAVHCVKILSETDSNKEIESLIHWLKTDSIGAFGNKRYPFYNLHSRLYLLIALSRIAIDNPRILISNNNLFVDLALRDKKHFLIQKYAAEIAILLEKRYLGTYSATIVKELNFVTNSRFKTKKIKDRSEKINTPWDELKELDKNSNFYFSWDFDRYWFDPLGNVFGITGKQAEKIAQNVIVNEWKIDINKRFIKEPRSEIWGRHERKTWHSHGSYPRADDYRFYISYHGLMAVASKLLEKMPVVELPCDWQEDKWHDWLKRHTLTRSDGLWLSDARDCPPLQKRSWLNDSIKNRDDFIHGVFPDDFLNGLFYKDIDKNQWINVYGHWNDLDAQHEETFNISSAFVNPASSLSLLNALNGCIDPYDFKLPEYKEENQEINEPPFKLFGWICNNYHDKGIDEYDPHSADIYYPPYSIGEKILNLLELEVNLENKSWFHKGKILIKGETWSTEKRHVGEDREYAKGTQLRVKVNYLTEICKKLKADLIINVVIERRIKSHYYSRSNDEEKTSKNYSRVFIVSRDGAIRDSETCYRIR